METLDMTLNHLPVKTWGFLKMNEAKTTLAPLTGEAELSILGGAFDALSTAADFATIATGCGEQLGERLASAAIQPHLLSATEGSQPEAVRLTFQYADGDAKGNQILLKAEQNSVLTVLMDYTAPATARGVGVIQTKLCAEKSSTIRLVQVQRVGEDFSFYNDIGGILEQGASLELIQLVLSGHASYVGCQLALSGADSQFTGDIAYSVSGSDMLDMNYVIRHFGRNTTSNLHAAGSLRDTASKLFRGTIDFVRGAKGAVGTEQEQVLLIDENVVNQTIPLILCEEEDVAGNHGASIGSLDEEELFYLESRGISKDKAIELLSTAKLDAVANKIPNDSFQAEILHAIHGETMEEEANDE